MKDAVEHKEKTGTEVKAEKPKDAATTTVEGATKTPKLRVVKNVKFRLLGGVDPAKFKGQRQIIVNSMLDLGEGEHSVENIAKKAGEKGLQSKTPLEASAKFHLKGLAAEGAVQIVEQPMSAAA